MKEDKKPKRREFNLNEHWKVNFDYPFLGSHDFPLLSKNGKDVILTIKKFYQEEVTSANGSEWCNVVEFMEKVKPMIVNKVNFSNLQDAYKCDTAAGFIGKHVSLYVKKGVWAFGSKVNALRFRSVPPKVTKDPIKQTEIQGAAEFYAKYGNLSKLKERRLISEEQEKQIIELSKSISNDTKKA